MRQDEPLVNGKFDCTLPEFQEKQLAAYRKVLQDIIDRSEFKVRAFSDSELKASEGGKFELLEFSGTQVKNIFRYQSRYESGKSNASFITDGVGIDSSGGHRQTMVLSRKDKVPPCFETLPGRLRQRRDKHIERSREAICSWAGAGMLE